MHLPKNRWLNLGISHADVLTIKSPVTSAKKGLRRIWGQPGLQCDPASDNSKNQCRFAELSWLDGIIIEEYWL